VVGGADHFPVVQFAGRPPGDPVGAWPEHLGGGLPPRSKGPGARLPRPGEPGPLSPFPKVGGASCAQGRMRPPGKPIWNRNPDARPRGRASGHGEKMRFPRGLGPGQTAKLFPPLGSMPPRRKPPGSKRFPRRRGPHCQDCHPSAGLGSLGSRTPGGRPKHPHGVREPLPHGNKDYQRRTGCFGGPDPSLKGPAFLAPPAPTQGGSGNPVSPRNWAIGVPWGRSDFARCLGHFFGQVAKYSTTLKPFLSNNFRSPRWCLCQFFCNPPEGLFRW
jgi:hypothetical protein